jgi:hypothetical protein
MIVSVPALVVSRMIVFLKSIWPPLAVLHDALVEHLEEQLQHVGVRLLDLVEQHHRVRAPAHGLGQHAALAVAHVARRRSLERGDGVRLLELAHVDRDDVLLAAEQQVAQRERRLRLADARRADEHEHALGLVRVLDLGGRGAHALADHLQRVVLADDALADVPLQFQHHAHLVAQHLADRHPGPARDHLADDRRVDGDAHQRRLPLQRVQLRGQRRQLGAQRLGGLERRGRRRVARGRRAVRVRRLQRGAHRADALHQPALLVPARGQPRQPGLDLRASRGDRGQPLAVVGAERGLALQHARLHGQVVELPLRVLDRRRRRLLAERERAHAVSSTLTALSGSWRSGR